MASRVEQVYTRLRERIIDGEFDQGAPLSEKELASRFGTSRTPVREALSQLLAESLVERVPGRGYFVARARVEDLQDTFEVRLLIEGEAAARAARYATKAERDRLRELAGFSFIPEDRRSYNQAMERNSEFHLEVARASRNALMVNLVSSCLSHMTRFLKLGGHVHDESKDSNTEHQAIVDAIEAREPEEARHAMREHLSRTQKLMMTALMGRALEEH